MLKPLVFLLSFALAGAAQAQLVTAAHVIQESRAQGLQVPRDASGIVLVPLAGARAYSHQIAPHDADCAVLHLSPATTEALSVSGAVGAVTREP